MSKVISLKGLRFNRRRKMYSRPKRNLDIKPRVNTDIYKIFLSVMSILSVLIGSFVYIKIPSNQVNNYLSNVIKIIQSGDFTDIFKLLIFSEIIILLLCFILGTNLFGSLIITIVPIIKTVLAGYISGYMYNKFELNGVLFSLIFLVPYFSATCTAVIALTNESYIMSKRLWGSILQRKTTKDGSLQLFFVRFVIISFIDLIFILLETVILMSFGGKISLQ